MDLTVTMLPVIPIVAAAVSAVALIKTKFREYVDVSSLREVREFAKQKGIAVAADGSFDPNALLDGEPLLFSLIDRYQLPGYRQHFEALLSYGANPDICNSKGVPALIYALSRYALSRDDCDGIISTLLQHGANPNAMDSEGRTAVFFADSLKVLSVLKKAGATFNAVDAMGKPAFFYTPSIGRTMYFIQTAGVDVNVTDSEGKTIAFYISGPDDFLLLKTLEAEGLDIHAKDNSGNTFAYLKEYLCCAMRRYNKPASKRLYEAVDNNDIPGAIRALKEGADPDTRDVSVNGWNMIFLAIYKNNPEMIRELAHLGVDINHMNGTICPLEKAIYDKNEACVEMLLSLGANPKPAMGALEYSATPAIKAIFRRYNIKTK